MHPPPQRSRGRFGPGLLVAAAFIGPGSIATAHGAGAEHGLSLSLALLFSVIACAVLQEMAARLGLSSRKGLAEALPATFETRGARALMTLLIVLAIGLGNAAYEGGNLAGSALGMGALLGTSQRAGVVATAAVAGLLLWHGRYQVLERALIALVLVMSAIFVTTLLVVISRGQLRATFEAPWTVSAAPTVIALFGTTVVPYNLFLHASSVQEKWPADVPLATALRQARLDVWLSVGLGGLVTFAIMASSAAASFGKAAASDVSAMAGVLEPVLGAWAPGFFGLGLLAAGMSSAITAPLATSYALCGLLHIPRDAPRFRVPALLVLGAGALFAVLGTRPIAAIRLAQAANGVLLPIVAIFLFRVMNRRALLGEQRNGTLANLSGGLIVAVAILLGLFYLHSALGGS